MRWFERTGSVIRSAVFAAAVIAVASGAGPRSARAADTYWIGGTGNWSVPGNWNNGVPTGSDTAYLTNSGTAQIFAGVNAYARNIRIGYGSRIELQGGAILMNEVNRYQYVGYNATAGIFNQSGGSNYVRNLRLADDAGSSGTYTMTGGYLYAHNTFRVGRRGAGFFDQSGGTVDATNEAPWLGYYEGSSGTYRLSGTGVLDAGSRIIRVGGSGTGRFEWFRPGGLTAGELRLADYLGTLAMGHDFTAIPALVTGLRLNTLEVTHGATFTRGGGATLECRWLRIGSATGAGTLLQQAGSIEIGQTLDVGDGGTGAVLQTGGAVSTVSHLYLGRNSGNGTYRLNDGTLSVGGSVYGGTGDGTLILDGGALSHGGTFLNATNLLLGEAAGRSGAYTLAHGKVMNVSELTVGRHGTGVFNQSGGTGNVTNLRLGVEAAGVGTYALAGGTLNVAGQVSGGNGTGTLRIDGGTFAPGGNVAVNHLQVGISAAGSHAQSAHTYTVGTLTLGAGTYDLRGGTLNAGGVANAAGAGTLNLDGGTFIPSGAVAVDALGVGTGQAGSHAQTGQTYTVGTLTLGDGAYTLAGGTLHVTGNVINAAGAGTLALDGGTFIPGGSVAVDRLHVGATGAAAHTQTGGAWTAGRMVFGVLPGGAGMYTLAGGSLAVSDGIGLGSGSGVLILNGGALTLGGDLALTHLKVGVDAAASYVHSAGEFRLGGDLVVGSGTGSGVYRLEAQGDLSVERAVRVGHEGGAGRFEWYRAGGLRAIDGIGLGAGATLAMGHAFDAGELLGPGGMVGGLEGATLEVTRGAVATHASGAVTAAALQLGGSDGAGTWRLEAEGELTIAGGGALRIGAAGGAGMLEWRRAGGLETPNLVLSANGTLAMGFDFAVEELFDGSLYGGAAPAGIEGATVTITAEGRATQTTGSAMMGALALGAGGQTGTYQAQGGTLHAGQLLIGTGGPGRLELDSAAAVSVAQTLLFGHQAALEAAPGSRITMVGSEVRILGTDPVALSDLATLTLAFQPAAPSPTPGLLEVAGEDRGAVFEGYDDNFALGALIVGSPDGGMAGYLQLMDLADNQMRGPDRPAEALYLNDLFVHDGSTLDMNGLNVYYSGELVVDGTGEIVNGTPQFIPEPGSAALLLAAAAALARGAARRQIRRSAR